MRNRATFVALATLACSYAAAVGPCLLDLQDPFKTAKFGETTVLSFKGTLSTTDGYYIDYAWLEHLFNSTLDYSLASLTWNPDFVSITLDNKVNGYYSGEFFKITVYPDDPLGEYFYHPETSNIGDEPLYCEFVPIYTNGQQPGLVATRIGITIYEAGEPSVPGPAAVLPMALGLAGAALRRRVRK